MIIQDRETSFINVIKIAIPIALQQLLTASLHLVDTAFIVSLGDAPTAAIGAAGRFFFVINVTMFGFCSGMMVLSSQYWGINDKKTIRQAFGLGLSNLLIFGIIASALCFFFPKPIISVFTNDANVIALGASYLKIAGLSFIPVSVSIAYSLLLRSIAKVGLPLAISFVSVGVNTILNYALIFGNFGAPKLGIKGAAIATLTAAIIQCVLFIVISKIQKNIASASFSQLVPKSKAFVKKFYATSLPILGNEIVWCVGVSVYVMVLGRQGESNFAAYTIFSSFEQITFTFFIGLCSACSVILGKLVGRDELARAYDFSKKYIKYTILFSIFISIVLYIFAPNLVKIMNTENIDTYNMAVKILRTFTFIFPFFVLPYISIVGVFRSAGTPKIGMILDFITVWFIGIPFVILAAYVFKWPYEYIYLMTGVEHLVKSILCIIIFKKRKWLNPLTH